MPEPLRQALLLFPVGVAVGVVGSLIGVGGGFFVVPFLMLTRRFPADGATAASLGIVLLSAASATSANARRGRIDYRTGMAMAAATLPGAWLGRHLIGRISAEGFSIAFAALLLLVAVYLSLVRLKEGRGLVRGAPRELVDAEGHAYRYEVHLPLGLAVSLAVGLISSLFGVGGGLVLVPFLVVAFGMPIILATAGAQFIFVFTAAAGVLEAIRAGQLSMAGLEVLFYMGLGVALGAQVGVAIARRVGERVIRVMLSVVLVGVAALMILRRQSP